jgi:hypothetical protein
MSPKPTEKPRMLAVWRGFFRLLVDCRFPTWSAELATIGLRPRLQHRPNDIAGCVQTPEMAVHRHSEAGASPTLLRSIRQ